MKGIVLLSLYCPFALSVDAYELFLAEMNKQGLKDVQHGEFGADMQVSLVNEGPCTIIIDTDEWKKKE